MAKPSDLARHLGVSVRSVYGWQAAGTAPRPVELALFWETSFGRSTAECDAWNAVQTYKSLSESLRLEVENLRARVARLERIGNFGSSNEPDYQTFTQATEKPTSIPLTAR